MMDDSLVCKQRVQECSCSYEDRRRECYRRKASCRRTRRRRLVVFFFIEGSTSISDPARIPWRRSIFDPDLVFKDPNSVW